MESVLSHEIKIRSFQILASIATGLLLRLVLGLDPVWWLAWLAPVPLLLLAFRFDEANARWIVALAAIIGISSNFHYYRVVMPLAAAIAVVAVQAWLWVFVVLASRRLVDRHKAWWVAFVYPVLWVAVDTLMAAFLPDGNWASLAYSQSDVLPVLQIASLFGVGGVLFLIALIPSTLAVAISQGGKLRNGWIAYATAILLLFGSIGYGVARLRRPVDGKETIFGLIAVDDAIGLKASAGYSSNILKEYDRGVVSLAGRGAQVIVLPEKVAMLTPILAQRWQQHLGEMAGRNHVWLEAGVGIEDGKSRVNLAWLFTNEGALAASYQKHHMAPPERRDQYSSGSDYAVHKIDGQTYGLAVCKDMHFAALGRAYGKLQACVMLVPAWDFAYLDAWLEARTTVARGVENGYSVVRSSREGLLTVSDAYGRVLAERKSGAMPGSLLLAKMKIGDRVPTLYTHIGDLFGWICVMVSGAFLLMDRRGSVVAGQISED